MILFLLKQEVWMLVKTDNQHGISGHRHWSGYGVSHRCVPSNTVLSLCLWRGELTSIAILASASSLQTLVCWDTGTGWRGPEGPKTWSGGSPLTWSGSPLCSRMAVRNLCGCKQFPIQALLHGCIVSSCDLRVNLWDCFSSPSSTLLQNRAVLLLPMSATGSQPHALGAEPWSSSAPAESKGAGWWASRSSISSSQDL